MEKLNFSKRPQVCLYPPSKQKGITRECSPPSPPSPPVSFKARATKRFRNTHRTRITPLHRRKTNICNERTPNRVPAHLHTGCFKAQTATTLRENEKKKLKVVQRKCETLTGLTPPPPPRTGHQTNIETPRRRKKQKKKQKKLASWLLMNSHTPSLASTRNSSSGLRTYSVTSGRAITPTFQVKSRPQQHR